MVLAGSSDGIRVTVASGGHQLPLRLGIDGNFDVIGETGTIIGMLDTPLFSDASVALLPGDVVVLYTDGVTEGRRDGEFFGEERLRATVADAAAMDAQHIADALVAAALDFQAGDAKDDIAVLVVKLPA
jgi:sigma-B regulation protein RsbU (phosphoserine phosphatase)